MKKIFILFISTLTFISCSNDSSSNSDSTASNKAYCNITLNGQTVHHEFDEGLSFSYGDNNCTTNYSLRIQNVEQFENASYFLDLYFVHNEDLNNFQGYNVANTAVRNKGLDIINPLCYNNFDFIAEYEDKSNGTILNFNPSSSNTNTINSITLYREDSLEKVYAVKGNFSVTYKKGNGTLIPLIGDYRTFIYVLK